MSKTGKTRVAIYARVSTDKQNKDSPADQIRACRAYAKREGWVVVEDHVVTEKGISGASRHNRPGLLRLMERIAEWDVLLCFDFSRLGRSAEDLGWIRNRLKLAKRTAYDVSTRLEIFNVGAKVMGVMAEEYLEKLRVETKRGVQGRVERGFHGGGKPYGYRTVAQPSGKLDPHGRPEAAGYRLVIDPKEARVVRRIFRLYLAGDGLKSIAYTLNADKVPSPRPRAMRLKAKGWAFTAIQSMLRNPIYKGEYIWNKSEWIKDHETGKRKQFKRPESEWVRKKAPAIIDDALWRAVAKARNARSAQSNPQTRKGRGKFKGGGTAGRGKYLLSGLLKCDTCGGSFYQMGHGRSGCGRNQACGPEVCSNQLRVARTELEDRVLQAVETQVLQPEIICRIVDAALAAVDRAVNHKVDASRVGQLDGEIKRLVELAARVGDLDHVTTEIETRQAELAEVKARMAPGAEIDPVRLQTEIEAAIGDMRGLLLSTPEKGREALRLLFGPEGLRFVPNGSRAYTLVGAARLEWLVAGTGFEPVTFGL